MERFLDLLWAKEESDSEQGEDCPIQRHQHSQRANAG
jgi:hypothetical protein